MIDICDFAVGLSRQLDGRTMPSERPGPPPHGDVAPARRRRRDQRLQLPGRGVGWNTAVALVCGDTVVWKPSPSGALTAMACAALLDRAARECGAPPDLSGRRRRADAAQALVDSPDVALVSATGSERMGAEVAPRVAARFGRALLELGGNNAAVVAPSADLELAARGDHVRGGGHRRPALHVDAAAHRARGRRRRARRAARGDLGRCGSATRSTTGRSSGR